jgi:hypothetical protein
VWTPPLTSGCLPGVTRELLLHEIHVPGYSIEERALAPADLERADEVFITSTTRSLLPVVEIEGPRHSAFRPGLRRFATAFAGLRGRLRRLLALRRRCKEAPPRAYDGQLPGLRQPVPAREPLPVSAEKLRDLVGISPLRCGDCGRGSWPAPGTSPSSLTAAARSACAWISTSGPNSSIGPARS